MEGIPDSNTQYPSNRDRYSIQHIGTGTLESDLRASLVKSLCLSGGGIRGIEQLGVLYAICDSYPSFMDELRCIVGVSVGAMSGFLLVLGISPHEIFSVVAEIGEIIDPFDVKPGNLSEMGIYDLNHTRKLLENLCVIKTKSKSITFEELQNSSGKELIVVSSNLYTMKPHIFSHTRTPNCNVIDAVLCSCSIPFVFTRKYHGNDLHCDGALVSNLAIDQIPPQYNKCLALNIHNVIKINRECSLLEYIKRLVYICIISSVDASKRIFELSGGVGHIVNIYENAREGNDRTMLSARPEEKLQMFLKGHKIGLDILNNQDNSDDQNSQDGSVTSILPEEKQD